MLYLYYKTTIFATEFNGESIIVNTPFRTEDTYPIYDMASMYIKTL